MLADAAHNITDVFAVGAALACWRLSYRSPTQAHSYGWRSPSSYRSKRGDWPGLRSVS
jgi:Co/Zn/Cd efflux system component